MALLERSLNEGRTEERITVDRRGKIKCGMIRPGTKFPMSLDHFRVDKFPELKESYGDKPKALIVFMPSDDYLTFFSESYQLYAGGKEAVKVRSCDGKTCIHRINETVDLIGEKGIVSKAYRAGERSECICQNMQAIVKDSKGEDKANPKRCTYTMHLKAYVVQPPRYKLINPSCYLIESGSENSGLNIKSELRRIWRMNDGILMNIPFALSVIMVPGKMNAQIKFPVMHLQMLGMLNFIKPERSLQEGLSEDYLALIETPLIEIMIRELDKIKEKESSSLEDVSRWLKSHEADFALLSDADKDILRTKHKEVKEFIGGME